MKNWAFNLLKRFCKHHGWYLYSCPWQQLYNDLVTRQHEQNFVIPED